MEDIENIAVPINTNTIPVGQGVEIKKALGKLKNSNPNTKSIFVKTWGCGHNNSDSEYMAGLLASHGYEIIVDDKNKDNADVWLLNSCTVKGPSEQTFVNEIRKARDDGKQVVVAGCVPQANPKGKEWDGLSIIGVQQIDRVVEVVEETLKGHSVRILKEKREAQRKTGGASLDLPKIRKNPFVEIIPINTGCLNQCTYCKTKHARGDLGSYSPEEIIERVKSVIAEGIVEIWLTSEDLGAYGHDIGVTITELLWGIVEAIEKADSTGNVMLRVGMTNPPYILEHIEEMCRILQHPRVYAFLHVPVQAASDAVLNDMRRLYTQQDFRTVVDTLLANVPGISIATDVICGFPTETMEDFEETLALVAQYKFPSLHISQFYPRPGTPAARMTLLPTQEVKKRSRLLTTLFESYSPHDESLIGSVVPDVLFSDKSADSVHMVGHDKFYRQVLVPVDEALMGQKCHVRVTRVGKHFIQGEAIPLVKNHKESLVSDQQKQQKEKNVQFVRKKRQIVKVADDASLSPSQTNKESSFDPKEHLKTAKKDRHITAKALLLMSLPFLAGAVLVLEVRWTVQLALALVLIALYSRI